MNQISILGCGWLGLPLALSLKRKNFIIKGSTTSKDKLEVLRQAQIDSYLISLTENSVEGDMTSFLRGTDTLIINIPPKTRNNPSEAFSKKIKNLIGSIENSSIKHVLFVSSVSVFGTHQGVVDEAAQPKPDTTSGAALLKSEQLLMINPNFKTTVIRFGGLIGRERHPVKYLAGKSNLSEGNAFVHLIHLEDCIGIIHTVMEKGFWNEIVHGVYPEYPLKKEYYREKAEKMGLPSPVFNRDKTTAAYKRVLSKTLPHRVGYSFKVAV